MAGKIEGIQRITILNVPVDILPEDKFEDVIKKLFSDGRNHQIVLLSTYDLLKARRTGEWRTMIQSASLVIPISKPVIKAAAFLKRPVPVRYEPFDFIIRLLGVLEHYGKSLYVFGGTRHLVTRATENIRKTFPSLKLVGKHEGHFPKEYQANIIQAIRKATPTLLLTGKGVPWGERWIFRTMNHFTSGMYLWGSDVLEVFAKKWERPSHAVFDKGREWIFYVIRKPWKVFRIFRFIWFKMLVLLYRVAGK